MNKITDNIFRHITLFSIVGILTIIINDYLAFIVGMEIPKWFVSAHENLSALDFSIGVLILIFLCGYYYKYANDLFKDDKAQIPEASLNCFMVFVKMLPITIFWNIYIFAAIFVGLGLWHLGTVPSNIYFIIIYWLIVFINVIFIYYAKELKLSKEFFSLNMLKTIIIKTFGRVCSVLIEVIALFGLTVYLLYQIYNHLTIIKDHGLYLATVLLGLCCGAYIITLIHILYIKKIVRILKNKFN